MSENLTYFTRNIWHPGQHQFPWTCFWRDSDDGYRGDDCHDDHDIDDDDYAHDNHDHGIINDNNDDCEMMMILMELNL